MAYNLPTGDFETTTLNGALAAGAATATVGTGLNIPATNGILQIDYDSTTAVGSDNGPETISYATYTTATGALAGITRGIDSNTSDVAHADGASVHAGPSVKMMADVVAGTGLSDSVITGRKIDSVYAEVAGTGADVNAAAASAWTDVTTCSVSVTTAVTSTVYLWGQIECQNSASAATIEMQATIAADANSSQDEYYYMNHSGVREGFSRLLMINGVTAGAKTIKLQFRSASTNTFVHTTECNFYTVMVTSEA